MEAIVETEEDSCAELIGADKETGEQSWILLNQDGCLLIRRPHWKVCRIASVPLLKFRKGSWCSVIWSVIWSVSQIKKGLNWLLDWLVVPHDCAWWRAAGHCSGQVINIIV